jgi:hypothetical protein
MTIDRAPNQGVRTKKKRTLGPPSHAFTIQEFCDAHRISRSQYYELKKRGKAPAETSALGKILITTESAARWRQKLPKRKRLASTGATAPA